MNQMGMKSTDRAARDYVIKLSGDGELFGKLTKPRGAGVELVEAFKAGVEFGKKVSFKNLNYDINRKCDWCGKEYNADQRNLNRGWGLCCSKSCSAKLREHKKTGLCRCKNHNNAGLNEYKEGCKQDCFSCDYFML